MLDEKPELIKFYRNMIEELGNDVLTVALDPHIAYMRRLEAAGKIEFNTFPGNLKERLELAENLKKIEFNLRHFSLAIFDYCARRKQSGSPLTDEEISRFLRVHYVFKTAFKKIVTVRVGLQESLPTIEVTQCFARGELQARIDETKLQGPVSAASHAANEENKRQLRESLPRLEKAFARTLDLVGDALLAGVGDRSAALRLIARQAEEGK